MSSQIFVDKIGRNVVHYPRRRSYFVKNLLTKFKSSNKDIFLPLELGYTDYVYNIFQNLFDKMVLKHELS